LVAAPSALRAATAIKLTIIVEATTSISVRPWDFGFRIADFGLFEEVSEDLSAITEICNPQSAIRNQTMLLPCCLK
jgi:hypothetical protein